jgi:hypothetical protein
MSDIGQGVAYFLLFWAVLIAVVFAGIGGLIVWLLT